MFDLESCLVCPPPFGEQWEVRANYWRRWNQLSIDFFDGFNLRLFSIEKHEAKKMSRLWRNFLYLILTPTQIKKEKDMLNEDEECEWQTELQTWGIQTDSNKDAKQIYLFINRWKYCANTGNSSNCYKERENKIWKWQCCVNLRAPAAQQRPSRLLLQINNIDQRSMIAKVV